MTTVPSLSPREVLEILFKAGFEKVRTTGSHIRLRKGTYMVTIAYHSRGDVPKGTFRSILHQAHLTLSEFLSYRK